MSRSSVFVCTSVSAASVLGLAWMAPVHAQQNPVPAQPTAPTQQVPPAPAGPLAPEKYLNIQAFKDLPAAQLHDTMIYMEAAVGANCAFCHVRNEAGEFAFEKDDKSSKKTTREMIVMTRNINAQAFKGQLEVTCATCHQGRHTPNAIPRLAETLTAEQLAAHPPQRPGTGPGPVQGPGQGAEQERGQGPLQPPGAGTAPGQGQGRGQAPGQPPAGRPPTFVNESRPAVRGARIARALLGRGGHGDTSMVYRGIGRRCERVGASIGSD